VGKIIVPLPLILTYPDIYKFATLPASGFSITGVKSGLIILCLDMIALGKKLPVEVNRPELAAVAFNGDILHSSPSVIAEVLPLTKVVAIYAYESG
jgi:hypothetical protein